MPKPFALFTRFFRRNNEKGKKKEKAQAADVGNINELLNAEQPLSISPSDDIGALELFDYCEAPDRGIDLIFVHGLHGFRVKTWSKDDIFWPRDLLKDDLRNTRVITWGYDANIANASSYASKESLSGHSNALLNDLARLRRGITRNIIFICHSLGGLVVKMALNSSATYLSHKRHHTLAQIYAGTIGVMFMGTPHRGSSKAAYGEIVAGVARFSFRQPNKQLLQALKPDQEVLERLRDDFTTVSNNMYIVCIREEIPTTLGMIVPESSASYDGFNVIRDSIHANHMDMVKFSSKDEGYRRVLGHIQDILDAESSEAGQDSKILESRKDAILEELRFDAIDAREYGIEDAYEDTCSWILDGESDENKASANPCKFLSWLQSDETFHWISGKAGCGKSTVMKYAYHDKRTKAALQNSQWAKDKNLILMGHFFFELGDMNQSSREGMLRTILYQELKSRRELIPKVFSKLDLSRPGECRLPKDFLNWNNLRRAFISMLNHLQDSRICLFLDGLDEYRMADRKNDYTEEELDLIYEDNEQDESWGRSKWITDGHKEIAEFIHSLRTVKNVKVCISSRELNVFEQEFRDFPRIKVHEYTADSIAQYCKGFLTDKVPQLSNIPKLASEVTEKSCGVFIWVRLVIGILIDKFNDGGHEHELHKAIDSLPEGLGGKAGLYMRMMENVRREYLPESKRLFDLVLRWSERLGRELDIITLFSAEPWHFEGYSQDEYPRKTWEELRPECERLQRRLKARCAGLLEGTTSVQFMHQTAKQFLSRKYVQNKFFLDTAGYAIPDVDLALMSGLIQRLKHCSEAVINFDSSIDLPNRKVDDVYVPNITRDLLNSILDCAKIESFKAHNLTSDTRYSYIELLDELDDVGGKLIRNNIDSLEVYWAEFFFHGTDSDNNPARIENFWQLAFLKGLFLYMATKIKDETSKDRLESYLSQFHRYKYMKDRSGYSWVDTYTLDHLPAIYEMIFEKGIDPNCLDTERPPPTGSLNRYTVWEIHLLRTRESIDYEDGEYGEYGVWAALTKVFLKYGADPTINRAEWEHHMVEDIIKYFCSDIPELEKEKGELLRLLDEAKERWKAK